MTEYTISELNIYPIKSCKAISLQTTLINPKGFFAFDRLWMITKPTGKFITQRQDSRLALIQPSLPSTVLSTGIISGPEDTLTISAPGMATNLTIPLLLPKEKLKPIECEIWEWKGGHAHDEGDTAAAWLSEYLGKPVRLVRYIGDNAQAQRSQRDVDPQKEWIVPPPSTTTTDEYYETQFSDAFPFLITTEEALAELNKHIEAKNLPPIPMNRFRPNIVVKGAVGFEEDSWSQVKVGEEVVLDVVKPCDRCKVPTIDQATGVVGDEPTDTLQAIRRGSVLGWTNPPSFKVSVFFGNNAVWSNRKQFTSNSGDGSNKVVGVKVGDKLDVLKRIEGAPKPLNAA